MLRGPISSRALGMCLLGSFLALASHAQTTTDQFARTLRAANAFRGRVLARPNASRRRTNGFRRLMPTASGVTLGADAGITAGLVSSNGQRPTANIAYVDGVNANLGLASSDSSIAGLLGALPALTAYGGTASLAPVAQASEIVISTMSTSQQAGGAVVSLGLRSGSNSFRGALSETTGNEILNANDSFAKSLGIARPPARANLFNAVLGGPLATDRAWFFVGYDGLRLRQGAFAQSEVPLDAVRAAAPSAIRPVFDAFPRANRGATSDGFGIFASSFALPAAHDAFGLRLDFQPASRQRFGGRVRIADSEADERGGRYALSNLRRTRGRTESYSVDATLSPVSRLNLSLRAGYSRNRVERAFRFDGIGGATAPSAPFGGDLSVFDFGGRAALADGNRIASTAAQATFDANATRNFSKHALTAGVSWRDLSLRPGAAATERSVLFDGPSATALASRIINVRRAVGGGVPRTKNLLVFVKDELRPFSRVSLSLVLAGDAEASAGPNGPELAGFTTRLATPSRNLAPRVAGTWDMFDRGKTIFRAGAGLHYHYAAPFASESFAESFPAATASYAFDALPGAATTNAIRPLIAFERNLRRPRVWHYYAEVQHSFTQSLSMQATWTTSLGRNLLRTRTVEGAAAGGYGFARLTTSDGRSRFDSLQIVLERRALDLTFKARYAVQRSRDDFSADSNRDFVRASASRLDDIGYSDFDSRHQLAVWASYEVPELFESGWRRALLDDTSLSVVATARSAMPVAVGTYRYGLYGREFVRADAVAGNPFYVGEDDAKTLSRNAFAPAAANSQGNLARGAVRGFGFSQIDARVLRRLRITNEMRFELTLAAFNLLNSSNPSDYSGILGTTLPSGAFVRNPFFGRPTASYGAGGFTPFNLYGGPRTVQAGVRFVF